MAGEARPIKLVDPFITLGEGEVGPPVVPPTNFQCFCKGVHLMGEQDDALATFCDPLGYSWKLSLDLLMSLGPNSLDAALTALGGPGTVIPFEFAYTPDVASATNPHWAGTCRLTAWPVVDAGINEPTEFTMDMDVIGEITRTPPLVVLAEAAA